MKQAEDGRQGNLYQALLEYSGQGVYPFHMPGHKRRTEGSVSAGFPESIFHRHHGDSRV